MANETPQHVLDQYLNRVFRNAAIASDQDLFETGFMNSLRAMHLVLFLEKTFRFRFAPTDIKRDRFRSRAAILELLDAYVGHQAASPLVDR
jgi:methoxymalonate biosynthesis acyl carrier protein